MHTGQPLLHGRLLLPITAPHLLAHSFQVSTLCSSLRTETGLPQLMLASEMAQDTGVRGI